MSLDSGWLMALLLLIASVGAGCFYAGWRSAAAYLPAARSVADVSRMAVDQANTYYEHLDTTKATLASLESAVTTSTKAIAERQQGIEEALLKLFDGLERAGLARSSDRRAVPRQVGEPPEPA